MHVSGTDARLSSASAQHCRRCTWQMPKKIDFPYIFACIFLLTCLHFELLKKKNALCVMNITTRSLGKPGKHRNDEFLIFPSAICCETSGQPMIKVFYPISD